MVLNILTFRILNFMVILIVIGQVLLMTWEAQQVFVSALDQECFHGAQKKQDVVAQSTAEAEYVAATAAVNQAIWIRKILADLHMKQNEPTQIYVDNQAAISISNNPVFHGRTKHFKMKLYFLREEQREGEINLLYCRTEDQTADVLTKALSKARFEALRDKLGLYSYQGKEECWKSAYVAVYGLNKRLVKDWRPSF